MHDGVEGKMEIKTSVLQFKDITKRKTKRKKKTEKEKGMQMLLHPDPLLFSILKKVREV